LTLKLEQIKAINGANIDDIGETYVRVIDNLKKRIDGEIKNYKDKCKEEIERWTNETRAVKLQQINQDIEKQTSEERARLEN
jgi:gas vesicle protein